MLKADDKETGSMEYESKHGENSPAHRDEQPRTVGSISSLPSSDGQESPADSLNRVEYFFERIVVNRGFRTCGKYHTLYTQPRYTSVCWVQDGKGFPYFDYEQGKWMLKSRRVFQLKQKKEPKDGKRVTAWLYLCPSKLHISFKPIQGPWTVHVNQRKEIHIERPISGQVAHFSRDAKTPSHWLTEGQASYPLSYDEQKNLWTYLTTLYFDMRDRDSPWYFVTPSQLHISFAPPVYHLYYRLRYAILDNNNALDAKDLEVSHHPEEVVVVSVDEEIVEALPPTTEDDVFLSKAGMEGYDLSFVDEETLRSKRKLHLSADLSKSQEILCNGLDETDFLYDVEVFTDEPTSPIKGRSLYHTKSVDLGSDTKKSLQKSSLSRSTDNLSKSTEEFREGLKSFWDSFKRLTSKSEEDVSKLGKKEPYYVEIRDWEYVDNDLTTDSISDTVLVDKSPSKEQEKSYVVYGNPGDPDVKISAYPPLPYQRSRSELEVHEILNKSEIKIYDEDEESQIQHGKNDHLDEMGLITVQHLTEDHDVKTSTPRNDRKAKPDFDPMHTNEPVHQGDRGDPEDKLFVQPITQNIEETTPENDIFRSPSSVESHEIQDIREVEQDVEVSRTVVLRRTNIPPHEQSGEDLEKFAQEILEDSGKEKEIVIITDIKEDQGSNNNDKNRSVFTKVYTKARDVLRGPSQETKKPSKENADVTDFDNTQYHREPIEVHPLQLQVVHAHEVQLEPSHFTPDDYQVHLGTTVPAEDSNNVFTVHGITEEQIEEPQYDVGEVESVPDHLALFFHPADDEAGKLPTRDSELPEESPSSKGRVQVYRKTVSPLPPLKPEAATSPSASDVVALITESKTQNVPLAEASVYFDRAISEDGPNTMSIEMQMQFSREDSAFLDDEDETYVPHHTLSKVDEDDESERVYTLVAYDQESAPGGDSIPTIPTEETKGPVEAALISEHTTSQEHQQPDKMIEMVVQFCEEGKDASEVETVQEKPDLKKNQEALTPENEKVALDPADSRSVAHDLTETRKITVHRKTEIKTNKPAEQSITYTEALAGLPQENTSCTPNQADEGTAPLQDFTEEEDTLASFKRDLEGVHEKNLDKNSKSFKITEERPDKRSKQKEETVFSKVYSKAKKVLQGPIYENKGSSKENTPITVSDDHHEHDEPHEMHPLHLQAVHRHEVEPEDDDPTSHSHVLQTVTAVPRNVTTVHRVTTVAEEQIEETDGQAGEVHTEPVDFAALLDTSPQPDEQTVHGTEGEEQPELEDSKEEESRRIRIYRRTEVKHDSPATAQREPIPDEEQGVLPLPHHGDDDHDHHEHDHDPDHHHDHEHHPDQDSSQPLESYTTVTAVLRVTPEDDNDMESFRRDLHGAHDTIPDKDTVTLIVHEEPMPEGKGKGGDSVFSRVYSKAKQVLRGSSQDSGKVVQVVPDDEVEIHPDHGHHEHHEHHEPHEMHPLHLQAVHRHEVEPEDDDPTSHSHVLQTVTTVPRNVTTVHRVTTVAEEQIEETDGQAGEVHTEPVDFAALLDTSPQPDEQTVHGTEGEEQPELEDSKEEESRRIRIYRRTEVKHDSPATAQREPIPDEEQGVLPLPHHGDDDHDHHEHDHDPEHHHDLDGNNEHQLNPSIGDGNEVPELRCISGDGGRLIRLYRKSEIAPDTKSDVHVDGGFEEVFDVLPGSDADSIDADSSNVIYVMKDQPIEVNLQFSPGYSSRGFKLLDDSVDARGERHLVFSTTNEEGKATDDGGRFVPFEQDAPFLCTVDGKDRKDADVILGANSSHMQEVNGESPGFIYDVVQTVKGNMETSFDDSIVHARDEGDADYFRSHGVVLSEHPGEVTVLDNESAGYEHDSTTSPQPIHKEKDFEVDTELDRPESQMETALVDYEVETCPPGVVNDIARSCSARLNALETQDAQATENHGNQRIVDLSPERESNKHATHEDVTSGNGENYQGDAQFVEGEDRFFLCPEAKFVEVGKESDEAALSDSLAANSSLATTVITHTEVSTKEPDDEARFQRRVKYLSIRRNVSDEIESDSVPLQESPTSYYMKHIELGDSSGPFVGEDAERKTSSTIALNSSDINVRPIPTFSSSASESDISSAGKVTFVQYSSSNEDVLQDSSRDGGQDDDRPRKGLVNDRTALYRYYSEGSNLHQSDASIRRQDNGTGEARRSRVVGRLNLNNYGFDQDGSRRWSASLVTSEESGARNEKEAWNQNGSTVVVKSGAVAPSKKDQAQMVRVTGNAPFPRGLGRAEVSSGAEEKDSSEISGQPSSSEKAGKKKKWYKRSFTTGFQYRGKVTRALDEELMHGHDTSSKREGDLPSIDPPKEKGERRKSEGSKEEGKERDGSRIVRKLKIPAAFSKDQKKK